jgi:hypothetical protein
MRSLKRVWYVFGAGVALSVVFLSAFRFREFIFPPPPGYSVALLGALAVVMTFVLSKEPSKSAKAAWIVAAFSLMVLEMWAISHDRREQNANFQTIAIGITTSIQQNQTQLEATMQGFTETRNQFNSEAQRLKVLKKEISENGIEAVIQKHQKLRRDIAILAELMRISDRGYQETIASITQSNRFGDKQARLKVEQDRYERQFEKVIKPQFVDLATTALIETGQIATPDKARIPGIFGLRFDSATNAAQALEMLAAQLKP